MFAPLLFILLAIATAGVMAYGTNPNLATVANGVDIICTVRRLQWPLATVAVVLCLAVVVMVVAGRRRAWWLIGLAPVVSLFAHAFAMGPMRHFAVAEDPTFVSAADTTFINDDDHVVGLTFAEQAHAFPYSALFNAPVVVLNHREQRLLLLWNPYANRATAALTTKAIKASELDLVSMPANALLIYNRRNGQFINGLTGLAQNGARPAGVKQAVATTKTTWRQWRTLHPQTRVMLPNVATGPGQPLLPAYPLPETANAGGDDTLVTVITGSVPVAIAESPPQRAVANFNAGDTKVLLLPAALTRTGQPVAFNRQVKDDLFPAFNTVVPDERRGTMLIDADSGSLWTLAGQAASGPLAGEQLSHLPVDTGLYYRVMKFWYPDLTLVTPEPPPTIRPFVEAKPPVTRPRRR